MAILLGERAHLIEFPSLLLPPGATAGSIVNISVTQNREAEQTRDTVFWKLQDEILDLFGQEYPKAPELIVSAHGVLGQTIRDSNEYHIVEERYPDFSCT